MTIEQLIAELTKTHGESLAIYNELNDAFADENYEEDYSDTTTRLYEEGFSGGIGLALSLIRELSKEA